VSEIYFDAKLQRAGLKRVKEIPGRKHGKWKKVDKDTNQMPNCNNDQASK
jgi:hypothetical protein